MKRIALAIAATLISALPVLAAEGMGNGMMGQDQQNQKNECLLMAQNCDRQIDTIQQRIGRIDREIRKGEAVYTRGELMHLRDQLEDANKMLETLTIGGGA